MVLSLINFIPDINSLIGIQYLLNIDDHNLKINLVENFQGIWHKISIALDQCIAILMQGSDLSTRKIFRQIAIILKNTTDVNETKVIELLFQYKILQSVMQAFLYFDSSIVIDLFLYVDSRTIDRNNNKLLLFIIFLPTCRQRYNFSSNSKDFWIHL
jgi:hypothetical protein